jgi:general secretion pathway protein A
VYAAHFGLTERPFSLAPDPRYLFLSDGHREALAHLVYGLQGGGFVQLTGEVGTGKTTVSRALLDQLPPEVDVAMVFTPRVTAVELLATVCQELRIDVPPDTTSAKVFVDALSRRLLDTHARGRRTVVIIDEAQNLSMEVLEEVRLLTNLETTREKLLQVILIGQPELVEMMQRPELRQLAQRVTARYHLRPFKLASTEAYVQHRLEVAGGREPIFTRAALWIVHRRSGGIPRLINNICDRALLGAFARGKRRITAGIARRAAAEVLGPGIGQYILETGVAGAVVAAILAGVTLLHPNALEYVKGWWAKRIMPHAVAMAPGDAAGVTLPSAVAAPAVAVLEARAALGTLLDGTRDQDAAFTRLFAAWGEDYGKRADQAGCDYAQRVGLRCFSKAGTWTLLRRLDLPAMLTLTMPGGRHYVTMTRLRDDTATLDIGGKTVAVPLADIDRYWDGSFLVVWRAPGLGTTVLRPGMASYDVVWLRERLAAGASAPKEPTVYDEELARRVVAFQQANGLTPDGVLGDETLLRIAATAPDARMPSLSQTRP